MQEEIEEKINIVTHQERIVSRIPLPYPLAWLILGELVFLIHFLTVQFYEASTRLILGSITLSILIFLQGSVIVWASRQLENFYTVFSCFVCLSKEDRMKWYNEQMQSVFNNKISFFSGLTVGLGILLTVNLNPSWPSWFTSPITKISFNFLLAIAAYLMGAAFYVAIMTGVFIINISKLPLKISIYQHPNTSVTAIGYMFVKFAFATVIVYSLWVVAMLCSPLVKTLADSIILFWVLFYGLFTLLYFIIPQYKVHDLMAKEKHEKIRKFSSRLDDAMEMVTENPTAKNIVRLRQLLEIQHQLNEMQHWPFDMRSFLYVLSAVIIPLVVVAINCIFG